MSEWKPIKTAPKDGQSILIWGPWGQVMQASWDADGWWKCGRPGAKCYDDTGSMEPSHWMPLPSPPNTALTGRANEEPTE